MHLNTFLYKTFHSVHHRLYVPYAYGALYNHPLEGFLLDSVGAALAEAIAFMSTREATLLFVVSTLKTVDDHCGYRFPWDPLQMFCENNADYHDIHHQVRALAFLDQALLMNFLDHRHQEQLCATLLRPLGRAPGHTHDKTRYRGPAEGTQGRLNATPHSTHLLHLPDTLCAIGMASDWSACNLHYLILFWSMYFGWCCVLVYATRNGVLVNL